FRPPVIDRQRMRREALEGRVVAPGERAAPGHLGDRASVQIRRSEKEPRAFLQPLADVGIVSAKASEAFNESAPDPEAWRLRPGLEDPRRSPIKQRDFLRSSALLCAGG